MKGAFSSCCISGASACLAIVLLGSAAGQDPEYYCSGAYNQLYSHTVTAGVDPVGSQQLMSRTAAGCLRLATYIKVPGTLASWREGDASVSISCGSAISAVPNSAQNPVSIQPYVHDQTTETSCLGIATALNTNLGCDNTATCFSCANFAPWINPPQTTPSWTVVVPGPSTTCASQATLLNDRIATPPPTFPVVTSQPTMTSTPTPTSQPTFTFPPTFASARTLPPTPMPPPTPAPQYTGSGSYDDNTNNGATTNPGENGDSGIHQPGGSGSAATDTDQPGQTRGATSSKEKLSAGDDVGIVMGVLVLVAIATIVGAYVVKQKNAKFGDTSVHEQGDLEMELVPNNADTFAPYE